MERLIGMLNLMSASTLVATGVYMQIAFVGLLTDWVRLTIVVAVSINFFATLLRVTLTVLRDAPVTAVETARGNIA